MSDAQWLMWEARAADGQADALVAWALDQALASAQVYRSADRVVVIAPAAGTPLPDPPNALLARPVYAWPFERLR